MHVTRRYTYSQGSRRAELLPVVRCDINPPGWLECRGTALLFLTPHERAKRAVWGEQKHAICPGGTNSHAKKVAYRSAIEYLCIMSKTRILCHVVFCTKERRPTIRSESRKELYAYIIKIINDSKCGIIRINGVTNHVHILLNLHPSVALANLLKEVKVSTSLWMQRNAKFPDFESWGKGYFASSVSPNSVEACIKYIDNQESHHAGVDFGKEMEKFCRQYGLEWFDDDWR